VLKSNFVNKKAQENFERITMKRLITIYDGEASVVETWLAFIRKWQFYGVGIKANVWQWEELGKFSFLFLDSGIVATLANLRD
jgi:small subunit ribosomal protein S10